MSASQAIDFVCQGFFNPTVDNPECGKKVRDIAKNYRSWARSFTHTGDLFDFLKFLEASTDTMVFSNQTRLGLPTITDAISEFELKFHNELSEKLTLDRLEVGKSYSIQMIHAFCRSYDLRSGGILPVFRDNGETEYVAVKATLSGGSYSNEWIDRGSRLKYFMKSIGSKFKETYQANSAIINNPRSPVLVFVRDTAKERFTFWGRFFPFAIHTEADGSKWFEFVEWSNGLSDLQSATAVQSALADQVRRSMALDPEARLRRIAAAPKQPEKQKAITTIFKRNPDVIAEVLYRADGICEACRKPAPFTRQSNGTPYLEVHHKIPLAVDGPDTVENAVALCPNCHRREHSGPANWPH